MKKTTLSVAILALVTSISAFAAGEKVLLDCKVSKMIDSTYFEEGLSKEEYPHVDLRKDQNGTLLLGIGCHSDIGEDEGDLVEVRSGKAKGSFTVIGRRGDREDIVVLKTWLTKSKAGNVYRVGSITVYEEKDKPIEIARLYCKR